MFVYNSFFKYYFAILGLSTTAWAGLVDDVAEIMREYVDSRIQPPLRIRLPDDLLLGKPQAGPIPIVEVLKKVSSIQNSLRTEGTANLLHQPLEVSKSLKEAELLCSKLKEVWGFEREPTIHRYDNGRLLNNRFGEVIIAPKIRCTIDENFEFDVMPIFKGSYTYFFLSRFGKLLDIVVSYHHGPTYETDKLNIYIANGVISEQNNNLMNSVKELAKRLGERKVNNEDHSELSMEIPKPMEKELREPSSMVRKRNGTERIVESTAIMVKPKKKLNEAVSCFAIMTLVWKQIFSCPWLKRLLKRKVV